MTGCAQGAWRASVLKERPNCHLRNLAKPGGAGGPSHRPSATTAQAATENGGQPYASSMRIHITYTGGTIGMVDSPHGLRPGADLTGWLSAQVEGTELGGDRLSLTSLSPLIDSANATPESWQRIIDDLLAHADPDRAPDPTPK